MNRLHLTASCLLTLTLTSTLGGCGAELGPEDNPTQLVDSSGVSFPWTCDERRCQLGAPASGSVPEPPCAAGDEWGFGLQWGRFHEICTVCATPGVKAWSTTDTRCRPTACSTDADCPQLYYYADGPYRFTCRSGLCQAEGDRGDMLTNSEVRLLCLAKLDRWTTTDLLGAATQQALAAADQSCPRDGTQCDVPASCWQP